jgi:hypothetical protein
MQRVPVEGASGREREVGERIMIDPAITALLGAAIGAGAGITGGVVIEAYKRRRDRQGTASALAGEISSILFITERRGYVAFFEGILPRLDAGENVPIGTSLQEQITLIRF